MTSYRALDAVRTSLAALCSALTLEGAGSQGPFRELWIHIHSVFDAWPPALQIAGGGLMLSLLTAGVKTSIWLCHTGTGLWRRFRLKRDEGVDLYSPDDIDNATTYYVSQSCQSLDPAESVDFGGVLAARESLFDVVDRFVSKPGDFRHMLLLAGTGLGKTAFALNYYADRRHRHQIAVVPLGSKHADSKILAIGSEKRRFITLILDGLDEDLQAFDDYEGRLAELMEKCADFGRVIVTCRTQFFGDEQSVPKSTGIYNVKPTKVGGRYFEFLRVYIAPFGDREVARFLQLRYPFPKLFQRKRAMRAARLVHSLAVRPFLLSRIASDLDVESQRANSVWHLYDALVDAWVDREKGWIAPDDLRLVSEQIAIRMFAESKNRGGEFATRRELAQLLDEVGRPGRELKVVSSRSLLNRSASGRLKFAHRSVLEFLVTDYCSRHGWGSIVPTAQCVAFLRDRPPHLCPVNLQLVRLRRGNLAGASFDGGNLQGADMAQTDLSGARLTGAALSGADLEGAKLVCARLSIANLAGAVLRGADLTESVLIEANLSGAILTQANLRGARLNGANLVNAKLEGTLLRYADLCEAHLMGANLQFADLAHANLRQARLANAVVTEAQLGQANGDETTEIPVGLRRPPHWLTP